MIIESKFNGKCRTCSGAIAKGDDVGWERGTKGVQCLECERGSPTAKAPPTKGSEGLRPTQSMPVDILARELPDRIARTLRALQDKTQKVKVSELVILLADLVEVLDAYSLRLITERRETHGSRHDTEDGGAG